LSINLVASTSWNPQGLSRPEMGLLYLYLLMMGYRYARNMSRMIDEINCGQIVCQGGFYYMDVTMLSGDPKIIPWTDNNRRTDKFVIHFSM
jgi:hypothetical protein